VAARTRELDLIVNVKGQGLAVSVAVSENLLSGLRSTDWNERARSYASLAKQAKAKLRRKYNFDTAGLFLTEREIEIRETKYVRKSKVKSKAANKAIEKTAVPAKKKKSRVHANQMTIFDQCGGPESD
jgi:hypothetical protein